MRNRFNNRLFLGLRPHVTTQSLAILDPTQITTWNKMSSLIILFIRYFKATIDIKYQNVHLLI